MWGRPERTTRTPFKKWAIAPGRARGLRRVQTMRKQRHRIISTIPQNIRIGGLGLREGEMKSVSVNGTNVQADSTGQILLLNGIARGDDIDQRTGRQVILKSIELHATNKVTDTTGLSQTHRVLLVFDSQANATALTIAQVLSETSEIGLKNLENRERFQILLDKAIDLSVFGQQQSKDTWKYYKKLNHKVTFNNGDAGTVADIVTGSLYLIVIGSQALGVTAGTMYVTTRIRFTDH